MGKKDKANVLFIIHDNYQDDNVFPLGIGYLASSLREDDVDVTVYCMDVFHYTNEALIEFLSDNEFDMIGMGFMAARFKRTVEALSEVINQHKKDAWFVIGGHDQSPIPEYLLNAVQADIVVIGEREETIKEIVHCKQINPNDISKIKGIAYRADDKVIVNDKRKLIKDLDSIFLPAWDLFPMEQYISYLKFAQMKEGDKAFPISTARGCIGCNFCYRLSPGIRSQTL